SGSARSERAGRCCFPCRPRHRAGRERAPDLSVPSGVTGATTTERSWCGTMGGMASFDPRTVAGRFRLFAVLEAVSWAGLLIGMAFKYLPAEGNEIGVKIFGPAHGAVFVLFVLAALLTAREFEWNWKTTVLALLSSIPPFCTVA